jgi:hypothetical protein
MEIILEEIGNACNLDCPILMIEAKATRFADSPRNRDAAVTTACIRTTAQIGASFVPSFS